MTFPIIKNYREQFDQLLEIPWAMIAPHEQQAQRNHGNQTLQRLAERGGLSACEACAVLEDRDWTRIEPQEADALLRRKVQLWQEERYHTGESWNLETREILRKYREEKEGGAAQ